MRSKMLAAITPMNRVEKTALAVTLTVIAGCLGFIGVSIATPLQPSAQNDGIVAIQIGEGHGSGVVVANLGNWWYVATAAHVPQASEDMNVPMMIDGNLATVVAYSDTADVAIVKFRSDESYHVYKLGVPKRGMEAVARGWLRGSRVDPLVRADFHIRIVCMPFDGSVAFQGGVYWGMSGSGIFNDRGEVIGIVSRATGNCWNGEPWAGLSLCESAEAVRTLLEGNL